MLIETLLTLRVVVGYLGERDQLGWWQSTFFGAGANAFLMPVFTRTHLLAQCTGAAMAAARVHDARIGVGHVYHLFRLPEALEMGIRRALLNTPLESQLGHLITNQASALSFLETMAKGKRITGVGPTRAGNTEHLRNPSHWAAIAGLYADAFQSKTEAYPYFTDRS